MPRIRIDELTTFGYRTLTTIGFWNVMPLNDDDDQEQPYQNARIQLEYQFLRYKLDILGVSEARWLGRAAVKTPSDHTVLLYNNNNFGTHTRNRARPRAYSKLWSA